MNIYKLRGSEWKIWDLHIHTPMSIFAEYGGDTEDIWAEFFNELENLPTEIKVLGINDYLFLDGSRKYWNTSKKEDLII